MAANCSIDAVDSSTAAAWRVVRREVVGPGEDFAGRGARAVEVPRNC